MSKAESQGEKNARVYRGLFEPQHLAGGGLLYFEFLLMELFDKQVQKIAGKISAIKKLSPQPKKLK